MSFFVVYLMGNVTTWRIAAGITASLPVITALYVTQVHEYPTGKYRVDIKSLPDSTNLLHKNYVM
jgi:hypothetical protein